MGDVDWEVIEYHVVFFPNLLRFMREVVNSLSARPNPDDRVIGCAGLARKIYNQAASVYYLAKGTHIFGEEKVSHILDFASIITISRSILETYLTLFEVYFEPNTPEELEYRIAVYKLKGFSFRETFVPDYKFHKQYEKHIKDIDTLRNRIRNTAKFKSFTDKNHREQSLQGKIMPSRPFDIKMSEAGFGPRIRKSFGYQSAFVHGDSLSVAQIDQNQTSEQATRLINPQLAIVMATLGKLIENYAQLFPESRSLYSSDTNMQILIKAIIPFAAI